MDYTVNFKSHDGRDWLRKKLIIFLNYIQMKAILRVIIIFIESLTILFTNLYLQKIIVEYIDTNIKDISSYVFQDMLAYVSCIALIIIYFFINCFFVFNRKKHFLSISIFILFLYGIIFRKLFFKYFLYHSIIVSLLIILNVLAFYILYSSSNLYKTRYLKDAGWFKS